MEINGNNIVNEETQETVIEVSKSQYVRIIDVVFIAPVLIYAGTFKQLPTWVRVSLIGIGIATAFYNGKNFIENRSNLQKKTNQNE